MNALKYKNTTQTVEDGRECILSDSTIDAYGDICEATPGSWLTDRFKKNPLALLNHSSSFPIGTWKNVRVESGALRGTLHLAPKGTSPRHDEVRALIDAKILVGLSVGFVPIESAPIANGGFRHTKMELMECSVVSIPANENALMRCRSLGISNETQRLLFKETSSIAQRIRGYRRSIRNLKDRVARETNPKTRASFTRAIAHLEKAEREMIASLQPRMSDADRKRAHSQEVRAKAEALLKRIDDRLMAEYEASWEGQLQRQRDGIEARRWRAPQDPPKPTHDSRNAPYGTWRGVKLPGPTWRGKPIR
jgi:HK97 family phage prohead protease